MTKLVRRHPHVFGDADARTPDAVESTWFAAKTKEKSRSSVTDGVPQALPSLVLAAKLLTRAEHGGVAVEPAPPPARRTADAALADVDDDRAFGDLLVALVAAGRARGWDAEAAARDSARRLRETLRRAEGRPE